MTRAALRVAYFAGSMRPGHDGVTRVLYRMVDALKSAGIANTFFSPIIPPAPERLTEMHRVPSVAIPLYPDYRFALPGMRHFENELGKFRPDILHINSPCSLGHAAVKYGLKHGIPVVATYHTHFPSYGRYYKISMLESFSWNYLRRLYNGCARTFVPSMPITEELRSHGIENLEYLPHGVDAAAFSPRWASSSWKRDHGVEGKTVLLFSGRLVWEKDLRTLAEAYEIVTRKRNDAAFVLVGDGPAREELKLLMPGAKFLGYQSGETLSATYASSDIFVFPSTTETFGNVTIEAMASGLPAICAKEGGAYGIIRDGENGLLVRPRDGADLAAKIERLLDSPTERDAMGARGHDFASAQTWENILDRLFTHYQDIVHNFAFTQSLRRRKAA